MGRPEQEVAFAFGQAENAFGRQGQQERIDRLVIDWAHMYRERKNFTEALNCLQRVDGKQNLAGYVQSCYAHISADRGDFDHARQLAKSAIRLLQASHGHVGNTLREVGYLFLLLAKHSDGQERAMWAQSAEAVGLVLQYPPLIECVRKLKCVPDLRSSMQTERTALIREGRELSELEKRFITSVWSLYEEEHKPLRTAAREKLESAISGLLPTERQAILDAWDEVDESAYAEYLEVGEALYQHAFRLGVALAAIHVAALQEEEKENPFVWKLLLAGLGNPALLDELAGEWLVRQHLLFGALDPLGEVLDG